MPQELIGQTLGERYHFEALLNEETFRVFDTQQGVTLSAKLLHIAHDPALLHHFQREAAILSHLQHQHIARYYDTMRLEDYVFILTDYIPGQTLKKVLENLEYVLTPRASLVYLTPLADALYFAHQAGVIHGDLNPGNILIHEDGTLYVTNFGTARILNEITSFPQGVTLDDPLYLSPEQLTGQPVMATADIYALGVILYQMVTGRVPFRGDSPESIGNSAARVAYEHVNLPPVPPTAFNPALSLAVQDVILRCLQKIPALRFQSVSAMYDAFAEAIGAPPMLFDPPTPPNNMKLPEWSQFMRSVPDDTPPEPITRPHLEKVMEPDSPPELTRPRLHTVLPEAHPTEPRKVLLPPPAYSPPLYSTERPPTAPERRSRLLILFTLGIIALIIVLCALGIYWFM